MSDAMKALWQDVDQEAADELGRGQAHDLHAITMFDAIVFPIEGDGVSIRADQPVVRNRHPVRVPAQVCQHGLGSSEGWLGIHHPVGPAQRREMGGEGIGVGQLCQIAEEAQLACLVQSG